MSAIQSSKGPTPNPSSPVSAVQCYAMWRQSTHGQVGFRSWPDSGAGAYQHRVEICSWLQVPELLSVQICAQETKVLVHFPTISDQVRAEQREIGSFLREMAKSPFDPMFVVGKIESCILFREGGIPGLGDVIRSGSDWIRASAPLFFEAMSTLRLTVSESPKMSSHFPIHVPRNRMATDSVTCLERSLPTKTLRQSDFLAMPAIGEGGQGIVKRSPEGSAYKIWHDSSGDPADSGAALGTCSYKPANEDNLAADYEFRLRKLPIWVDEQLALPKAFIRISERAEQVSGYEMPFIDAPSFGRLTNPGWKRSNHVSQADIAKPFVALYDLLWELQQMGVIVGDLKFHNLLLVQNHSVSLLDVDSLGVEGKPCTAYSQGYVDPRLCDPKQSVERLIKSPDAESVWYSYMVMLFEALIGVHPFTGGNHNPPAGQDEVSEDSRVMKGLSVFHPDVGLNKRYQDAITALPADLRKAFKATFQDGVRGRPRRSLITQLIPSQDSASQPYAPEKRAPWQLFPPQAGNTVGPFRGFERIARLPCRTGKALMAKIIDGNCKLLTDLDLEQVRRKIAPEVTPASAANLLKPLDFSARLAVYRDSRSAAAKNLAPGALRVWIDDGELPTIRAVGVSPFGRPNVVTQGDQVVWVPAQSSRVMLSKAGKSEGIELSGELSLFSGNQFGLIFSTEGNELVDVSIVSDGVKRISGLPPILGTVSDIECVFSDNFVWAFLTATPEQAPSRFILVLDATGTLRGLGAVPECQGAWHSAGVLRSAYDMSASRKPGLAAVVNGELVRLTCDKLQVDQYCRQRLGEDKLPRILLATENDVRGVW